MITMSCRSPSFDLRIHDTKQKVTHARARVLFARIGRMLRNAKHHGNHDAVWRIKIRGGSSVGVTTSKECSQQLSPSETEILVFIMPKADDADKNYPLPQMKKI